jgi:two-component system response regulator NreC
VADKIRIMLVDDHAVLRAGLRALFNQQPDMAVVAEASEAGEASKAAAEANAELIIVDLSLPGGGSLGLIERLRALTDPPKVLVLSMHDDPSYARAALAAGASGYVVKTVGEPDLLAAVRAVHRGRLFVDLDDEDRTNAVISDRASRSTTVNPVAKLSDRELEVLRLLGHGYGNQDVADRLELSPKTVATYRARIAEKLGLRTTADFVRYVANTGLGESPENLR